MSDLSPLSPLPLLLSDAVVPSVAVYFMFEAVQCLVFMFINCPSFSQRFSRLVIDQSECNIECSDAEVSVLSFEVKRQFDLSKDGKF